tara:strand:- start:3229 stop:3510 length:282 start_codon:yes stop_codon:yes gene_type:complete
VRKDSELQSDIDRMKRVENVINNPEYKMAFLILKAHIITEFEKLNYSKVDDMQEANRQLKTLDRIESHFNRILNDGKIAKKTLADKLKSMVGR